MSENLHEKPILSTGGKLLDLKRIPRRSIEVGFFEILKKKIQCRGPLKTESQPDNYFAICLKMPVLWETAISHWNGARYDVAMPRTRYV